MLIQEQKPCTLTQSRPVRVVAVDLQQQNLELATQKMQMAFSLTASQMTIRFNTKDGPLQQHMEAFTV